MNIKIKIILTFFIQHKAFCAEINRPVIDCHTLQFQKNLQSSIDNCLQKFHLTDRALQTLSDNNYLTEEKLFELELCKFIHTKWLLKLHTYTQIQTDGCSKLFTTIQNCRRIRIFTSKPENTTPHHTLEEVKKTYGGEYNLVSLEVYQYPEPFSDKETAAIKALLSKQTSQYQNTSIDTNHTMIFMTHTHSPEDILMTYYLFECEDPDQRNFYINHENPKRFDLLNQHLQEIYLYKTYDTVSESLRAIHSGPSAKLVQHQKIMAAIRERRFGPEVTL